MKKKILHLCADIGSDSRYYQLNPEYEVIKIGKEIGVENYSPPDGVHGIIANPPCTEFSTAGDFRDVKDLEKGMFLVNHCLRIINEANPAWWVLENPYNGRLKEIIGKPNAVYQPWQYGSPWTKKTALWGNFVMPLPVYSNWDDVPKNEALYIRNGRKKPGLVYFHKSAVNLIPEMQWAKEYINCDADIRSMCSNGFAKAFYEVNM
jgi:hypothetical protein